MSPRTTTPAIVGEEPPATAARASNGDPDQYTAIITELRKNPDRWAVIDTVETGSQAYRLTKAVREGKRGFSPAGAFEGRAHKAADKVVKVFVRFMGPEAKAAAAAKAETAETAEAAVTTATEPQAQ
jgi:hypothetical protein